MSSERRAPSPYAAHNAALELAEVRERLRVIDPTIEEDPALFQDLLDGEGGDALQVIERLIDASIEADVMADVAKQRQDDLAARRARFERRRDAYRAVAQQALEHINLRKLERAHFTASLSNHPGHVIITNDKALEDEYVIVERKPKKGEIGAALKAGKRVRGAEMSNGSVGLTIRTK